MKRQSLKILLADESPVVRERLAHLVSALPGVEIVGETESAAETLKAVRALKPDVLILDSYMPGGQGTDMLRALKQDHPALFAIMLNPYYFPHDQERCLAAGADVFLNKRTEFEQVAETLRLLLSRTLTTTDSRASLPAAKFQATIKPLTNDIKTMLRIPYALRRIPEEAVATVLPVPEPSEVGDIALCRLEKLGRNTGLELTSGRRCNLHEGDLLATVFGNRYATEQFEGYAEANGEFCDLLSMGGLCGLVKSKNSGVPDPTKLRILGYLGDANGRPLKIQDFALPPIRSPRRPRVIAVCGTSMDSGKTYTAFSLISGLQRHGHRVGAYKLTGTASGRDTWSALDGGARPSLDFIDGGYPSTYLCSTEELLELHGLLSSHAAEQGAEWVVIEIADGLLQRETEELLNSSRFTSSVDAWIFAAGDALAATGGVQMLRAWGIEPMAISGRMTMSPLAIKEAEAATGIACLTARQIHSGGLNSQLMRLSPVADLKISHSETAVSQSRLPWTAQEAMAR